MSKKPCEKCDSDYPESSGILMGRDDLWQNGWHTHKRGSGLHGHMVYKDESSFIDEQLADELKDLPNFPWEEGHEAYWDENAKSKFRLSQRLSKAEKPTQTKEERPKKPNKGDKA